MLTFFSKLLDKIAEALWAWLVQGKNWPLLIPLVMTPAGYLFVQNYFAHETPQGPQPGVPLTTALNFKEVLLHIAFQIICGTALVLSGMLWWVVLRRSLRPSRRLRKLPRWLTGLAFLVRLFYRLFPRKSWRRLLGSMVMVIAGSFLAIVGVPPRHYGDQAADPNKLVVAIGEFKGTAVKGAPNVASLLLSALQTRDAGAPVLVKGPYNNPIDDPDPDVKKANAVLLGKSKSAHIVVWGKVLQFEGGGLSATFDFAVANDWNLANDSGKGEFDAARKAYDPGLAPQKARGSEEQIANRIADVAALMLGLSYYRLGEMEKAVAIFSTVKSGEGNLWKGFCYRESSRTNLAIAEYEKVLSAQSDTDLDDDERRQLRGRASLLLGDAYADLKDFQTARTNYEAARDAFQIRTWKLQNSLGVTLFTLASLSPPAQRTDLLGKAEKAYRDGIPLLDAEEASADEHALLLLNLGTSVADLANFEDESRRGDFQRAKTWLETAKAYVSQEPSAGMWARIEHNLANTLAKEGNGTPSQAGFDLLQQAVEKYDNILKVCGPENDAKQFALTQAALGETHFDLSRRPENGEPEGSLLAARTAYKRAVEVWDRERVPIKAANSRRFLAEALLALANLALGDGRTAYLCEAIDNLERATQLYGASQNTQGQHSMTVARLSQASTALRQMGGHCP